MKPETGALPPEFAVLEPALAQGIEAMGLRLTESQRHALLAYLALLARWGRAYNLTAVLEPREMVARHLLDSLSLLPWLRGERVVDSGTGAGLPGVPLAIACPERQFVLIDGNGKKIRFLRQVRRELGLSNIEPIQARLENPPDIPPPDCITARALAPLAQLVEWHRDWLDQGATLLAMKSRDVENELSGLTGAYNVDIIDLNVPGEHARRCLAIVTRIVTRP
ncbi:16S rRNA (guanine(527)-N(7))-methyltransferase RsmG [Wenzhouxiangella marina]|uniref:Ribosomal RNA small subunit methyltransferase G n=1 Tax=Wenzhouxiangella marina TaxID=1579979 RepID=A0A0K0XS84_9GAMM|nr:16S rRNA (guanine(527)-N(7))-methyltransferase RsmG [Wenzhouxiangella marina]AKS40520.1 16S rRNA methyltransferase B [Wenzhouxiangella marina]MBB6088157.1 16S rRNA (guanine527-N7)-methyltransferase [Wenzhouxiangella marina]